MTTCALPVTIPWPRRPVAVLRRPRPRRPDLPPRTMLQVPPVWPFCIANCRAAHRDSPTAALWLATSLRRSTISSAGELTPWMLTSCRIGLSRRCPGHLQHRRHRVDRRMTGCQAFTWTGWKFSPTRRHLEEAERPPRRVADHHYARGSTGRRRISGVPEAVRPTAYRGSFPVDLAPPWCADREHLKAVMDQQLRRLRRRTGSPCFQSVAGSPRPVNRPTQCRRGGSQTLKDVPDQHLRLTLMIEGGLDRSWAAS